jgi:drug/metabolite transporter (DMT)-like permease
MAGMALGMLAYFLFGMHDATIKLLVESLPVWQVVMVRSAMITVGCLLAGRRGLLVRAIATPLKLPLLFRGAITLAAWLCYFTAARSLPLAQMTALYFAAPVMVTLMAAPLLGERVGVWRWLCVALGLAGVLAASDPFGVSASLASCLVLIAAALWAYGIILMRQIARRETSVLQMFYTNLFFFAATAIGTALDSRSVSWAQAGLLGAVGLIGGFGQFALFESARLAPAAVMATVEYTALPWAFVFGFLVWGDVPPPAIWVGAALIAAAGAVLVATERRR